MVDLNGTGVGQQSDIFVAQHQVIHVLDGLVHGLSYIVMAIGLGYIVYIVSRVVRRHGFIGIYDILTFAWASVLMLVFMPGFIARIMPGLSRDLAKVLASVGSTRFDGSISVALFFLSFGLVLVHFTHKMRDWKERDDERYKLRASK